MLAGIEPSFRSTGKCANNLQCFAQSEKLCRNVTAMGPQGPFLIAQDTHHSQPTPPKKGERSPQEQECTEFLKRTSLTESSFQSLSPPHPSYNPMCSCCPQEEILVEAAECISGLSSRSTELKITIPILGFFSVLCPFCLFFP